MLRSQRHAGIYLAILVTRTVVESLERLALGWCQSIELREIEPALAGIINNAILYTILFITPLENFRVQLL